MKVVHFPDLDLAADADGPRQLVLWYALRALDATGTGRVTLDQVGKAARRLGWTPRAVTRLLKGGAGVFWRFGHRGFVYLLGLAKIAAALGVRVFRAAYRASLTGLRGALASVRARLAIQAIAAIRQGAPIANETMARMADVDVRTIKRWKTLSRVRSFENFALVAPLRPGQVAADFRRQDPSLRTVRFRGRRWIARQLPDSFQTPDVGGRSLSRRANRYLRHHAAEASSALLAGGSTHRRRRHADERRRPTAALPSPVYLLTPLGHGRWACRLPVQVWGANNEEPTASSFGLPHGAVLGGLAAPPVTACQPPAPCGPRPACVARAKERGGHFGYVKTTRRKRRKDPAARALALLKRARQVDRQGLLRSTGTVPGSA